MAVGQAQGLDAGRQRQPVLARHADVGDDDADAGIGAQPGHRLLGAGSGGHAQPMDPQAIRQVAAHRLLVIHDEDGKVARRDGILDGRLDILHLAPASSICVST